MVRTAEPITETTVEPAPSSPPDSTCKLSANKYKNSFNGLKAFCITRGSFCLFSGYVRFDAPNYHTSFSFPVPKTRSNCLFQPLSAAFSCTERFSWFWSPAPGTFYLID